MSAPQPQGQGVSRMLIGQAGRNENEPHLMSVENGSTRKPSPYRLDEGCKESPGKQSGVAHHSGGVSVDGMSGNDGRVSQEICFGAPSNGGQPGAQAGLTGEALVAGAEVGVSRSSAEARDSITGAEPRGGACVHAQQKSKGQGDGWEDLLNEWTQIITPEKVRKLQRALYQKAKTEPKYRFWSLYGELCRMDILETALRLVARNGGCAGVDGVEIKDVMGERDGEEGKTKEWLEELAKELKDKRYRPSPVLRVLIPKADGKMRPLGIPTVKDRVAQAAAVLVLMPIFEAGMHEHSYAYRPSRNAHQAIDAIKTGIQTGHFEIIDADLSGYFDSIPHTRLMRLVARRISDGSMLKLIRAWLRAPIEERDGGDQGKGRRKANRRGTPQGGVISPLLANLYLDRLDKEVNGRKELRAQMVRYADDFVILSRPGQGQALLGRVKRWLEARGLKLNEEKTRLVDIRKEGIKFLGFSISWRKHRTTGWGYAHVEPHSKSQQKLRDTVKELLNHWTLTRGEEETIRSLNRKLKGWKGYFQHGNPSHVMGKLEFYIQNKLRRWLWKRHGKPPGQSERYSNNALRQNWGLYPLAWGGTLKPKAT
jgi:RNA-directed DNA polymerase